MFIRVHHVRIKPSFCENSVFKSCAKTNIIRCKNKPTVNISSAYIWQNNNFRWEKLSERFWACIMIKCCVMIFQNYEEFECEWSLYQKNEGYENWPNWIGNKYEKINYWIDSFVTSSHVYCNESVLCAHILFIFWNLFSQIFGLCYFYT